MGSWDPKKGMDMCWTDGNVWKAEARVPVGAEVDFKVGLVDRQSTMQSASTHSGAALEGNWSVQGDSLGWYQLPPCLEAMTCNSPRTYDTRAWSNTIQGVVVVLVVWYHSCMIAHCPGPMSVAFLP